MLTIKQVADFAVYAAFCQHGFTTGQAVRYAASLAADMAFEQASQTGIQGRLAHCTLPGAPALSPRR